MADESENQSGGTANSNTGGGNQDSGIRDSSQDGGGAQLGSAIREAAEPLKEMASDALKDTSQAGADRLGTVAKAVRDVAPKLEQDMPQIASSVRSAAGWLEKSAEQVRQQKFDEMLGSFSTFARSNPAVAFGMAAVAGFALSRFLKSGSQARAARSETLH